eukprot:scaffold7172_cov119-Alexandrium_tamarense.AAC.10
MTTCLEMSGMQPSSRNPPVKQSARQTQHCYVLFQKGRRRNGEGHDGGSGAENGSCSNVVAHVTRTQSQSFNFWSSQTGTVIRHVLTSRRKQIG